MHSRPTYEDLRLAAAKARRDGHIHLAGLYESLAYPLAKPVPTPTNRAKPVVCLIVDHRGWCGERLSIELMKHWPEFDCRIVRLGDSEHLQLDADLYLYRNITWFHAVPLPNWAMKKVVCLLESERPLESKYLPLYNNVVKVMPENWKLKKIAESLGIKNLTDPIGNGINTEEFHPARNFPTEFTVGAAGNFSLDFYDEWKGFSKYIIPACKLANVKLKWCSWMGHCHSMPNVKGEQVPMNKMGEWYRSLSCLVSMSVSEGCSGVIFEAMATGLPVISTRVGWHGERCGNRLEWINRTPASEETPEKIQATIRELANRILFLKNNPKVCRFMGSSARKFTEQWPHKRIAREMYPILAGVIEENRKAKGT